MDTIKKVVSVSAPGSFEGWNFLAWLKGNLKTIKEIVKVGAPLVLGLAFFKDNPALVATITTIGKLALDTLEFYLSNVEIIAKN